MPRSATQAAIAAATVPVSAPLVVTSSAASSRLADAGGRPRPLGEAASGGPPLQSSDAPQVCSSRGAEREVLADLLLGPRPQALGGVLVEDPRRVVVCRPWRPRLGDDAAAVEVGGAVRVELGRRARPHRRRGRDLHRVAALVSTRRLDELGPLVARARGGGSGANGEGVDSPVPEPPLETEGEERVRRLRLPVGLAYVVGAAQVVGVLPAHRGVAVGARAYVDDPGAVLEEERREPTGEEEVAEVVRAEAELEALERARGLGHRPERAGGDAGVVHEQVERLAARAHLLGGTTDARERGEVADQRVDERTGRGALDLPLGA